MLDPIVGAGPHRDLDMHLVGSEVDPPPVQRHHFADAQPGVAGEEDDEQGSGVDRRRRITLLAYRGVRRGDQRRPGTAARCARSRTTAARRGDFAGGGCEERRGLIRKRTVQKNPKQTKIILKKSIFTSQIKRKLVKLSRLNQQKQTYNFLLKVVI